MCSIPWSTETQLLTKNFFQFENFFFYFKRFAFLLFLRSPQNVYVNINRIVSVGSRLLESGHYASQQIKQISGQLEQEWKAFAAALDERSTLLEMSASFHKKCDQVSLSDLFSLQILSACVYIYLFWFFVSFIFSLNEYKLPLANPFFSGFL